MFGVSVGKRFLGFALFVSIFVAVSSPPVAFGAQKETKKGTPAEIRISAWKLPFNVPVMIELAKGSHRRAFPGMKVREVDMRTGPSLMAALAAGEVDIVQGVGDAALLVAVSRGVDACVVAVNSRSPRAFAVVTNNPEVKLVSDLRGRKVAGLRGSVVHEVFVRALGENGVKESEVEFFPMPIPQASATLLAGKVDAALLVGSEIVRAEKAGARVIADGRGRVRGLSFVVARREFVEKNPGLIRAFLRMRRETLAFMRSDGEASALLAAKETRMEPNDAARVMGWYDFDCTVTEADRKSMARTRRYLIDHRIIAKNVDVESLFE